MLYQRLREFSKAEPLLRRAVEIRRGTLAPDHPMLAWNLQDLAIVLLLANRPEEAEPLLREALAIRRRQR